MSCKPLWRAAGAAALSAALAWPALAQAQLGGLGGGLLGGGGSSNPQATASAQASAVRATVLGLTTSLADSGTVSDPSQPVGTGQPLGSIAGLASAESLHSAAMTWTDRAASQASLSNLALTVAGTGISADFLGSEAIAGATRAGGSAIEGLTIGGVPITPTGVANQLISLPGLSVILNEQTQTANGIVVNALRVRTLDGLTDIALGTSRAGI